MSEVVQRSSPPVHARLKPQEGVRLGFTPPVVIAGTRGRSSSAAVAGSGKGLPEVNPPSAAGSCTDAFMSGCARTHETGEALQEYRRHSAASSVSRRSHQRCGSPRSPCCPGGSAEHLRARLKSPRMRERRPSRYSGMPSAAARPGLAATRVSSPPHCRVRHATAGESSGTKPAPRRKIILWAYSWRALSRNEGLLLVSCRLIVCSKGEGKRGDVQSLVRWLLQILVFRPRFDLNGIAGAGWAVSIGSLVGTATFSAAFMRRKRRGQTDRDRIPQAKGHKGSHHRYDLAPRKSC